MTLKQKLETLTTEFTALKTKILTKLAQKDQQIKQKDTAIQAEQTKHQESIRQLETTLKENATNEQVLTKLLLEFQELAKQLE